MNFVVCGLRCRNFLHFPSLFSFISFEISIFVTYHLTECIIIALGIEDGILM